MIVCKLGELCFKDTLPAGTRIEAVECAQRYVAQARDVSSVLRMACVAEDRETARKTLSERLRGLISLSPDGKEAIHLLKARYSYTPVYEGGLFDENFLEVMLTYYHLV